MPQVVVACSAWPTASEGRAGCLAGRPPRAAGRLAARVDCAAPAASPPGPQETGLDLPRSDGVETTLSGHGRASTASGSSRNAHGSIGAGQTSRAHPPDVGRRLTKLMTFAMMLQKLM